MKRRELRTLDATDLSRVTGGTFDTLTLAHLAARHEAQRAGLLRTVGEYEATQRSSFLRTIADLMNG